ncbi:MAG: hypothetical protein QOH12_2091 [Solirubrobacteraceae bacterium]|jgi:hypothetical protein|nr:hypothetical protein [Solirubrobacteraceae bacterium]
MVGRSRADRAARYASTTLTSLIRLIFPNFDPAPTVENFGVRTSKDVIPGAADDRELEKRLDELLDRPRAAAA